MPERVSIYVEGTPPAFGHFSQVIKFGNQIHISGILPVDPATNRLAGSEMPEQARMVFKHLQTTLQACAGQLSNILSTRVYLVDLREHKAFDDVSKEVFFFTPPARTVVPVAMLPFGAKIMIEATAELVPVDVLGKRML